MKKVIRITEKDLTRIIKRVISEDINSQSHTLSQCLNNYKPQNKNWSPFKYIEKDGDKVFLRSIYKPGTDQSETNRLSLQRVMFITNNGVKSVLISNSLHDQQGLRIGGDYTKTIPYDKIKGNCSLIQKTLDDNAINFIKNKI